MNFREALLGGVNYRESYSDTVRGQEVTVSLRPMTDSEKSRLKVSDFGGIDFSDIVIDKASGDVQGQLISAFMKRAGGPLLERMSNQGNGDVQEDQRICALCIMSEEEPEKPLFTLLEVQSLFIEGLTSRIADRIRYISGLDEKAAAEMEPFREVSSGDSTLVTA